MEQLIFKGMETEEGRQAAALHNSIMAAKLAVSNALLDFCRGLKAMRDGKGYKALGFESFEEYSVNAVGTAHRPRESQGQRTIQKTERKGNK